MTNFPQIHRLRWDKSFMKISNTSLRIPKGESESLNRRTDNTMAKKQKENLYIIYYRFNSISHHLQPVVTIQWKMSENIQLIRMAFVSIYVFFIWFLLEHMGNWMRICFSHYLTQTLFQNHLADLYTILLTTCGERHKTF
jgi:hypothetical protein